MEVRDPDYGMGCMQINPTLAILWEKYGFRAFESKTEHWLGVSAEKNLSSFS